MQFEGRAIPYMDVVQGNNRYPAEEGDWSRRLHRKFIHQFQVCFFTNCSTCTENPMASTATLAQWVIFLPSMMANEVRSFVQQLRQVGQKQNFLIPEPTV